MAHVGSSRTDFGWIDLLAACLKSARAFVLVALLAGLAAGVLAVLSPRQFVSSTSFVPDVRNVSSGGLAAAARPFGIGVVGAEGGAWTAAVFVQVLQSPPVLLSIAAETVFVKEQADARVALIDLFEVKGATPEIRAAKLVKFLRRKTVSISESRTSGAVSVRVSTKWPSVSKQLAELFVARASDFNLGAQRINAQRELSFVDGQLADAQRDLAAAESELSSFLLRNRNAADPRLEFEKERLRRKINLREQLALALAQRTDDARLRNLRDFPAITVIEAPVLAAVGEPKGTIARAFVGAFGGLTLVLGFLLLRLSVVAHLSRDGSRSLELLLDALPTRLRAVVGRWASRS